jgi:hypothetical protein
LPLLFSMERTFPQIEVSITKTCGMVDTATSYYVQKHTRGLPTISAEPQTSAQAWKLIEKDYTLRLSLVAREWATEHLRAWNSVFAEGRKRGNSGYYGSALADMEIADADKRAEWSYRACCEIWDIQGRTKNRAFFRAIFDSCLQPMFSTREGCFRHALELHQKRTRARIPQGLSVIGGHMNREMSRLRAKWNTILEVATRDAENQERLKREQAIEQEARTIREIRERSFFAQAFGPRQLSAAGSGHTLAGTLSLPFTWGELEIRFQRLQAKTTPKLNVYAVVTRTTWHSGSINEQWSIGGNLVLQKEFENLGSIAARKLGYAPGNSACKNWLGRLREWMQQTGLDKNNGLAWRPSGSVNHDGTIGVTQSLYSEKIAELSAKFCLHLMAGGAPESTGSLSQEHSKILDGKSETRRPVRKTQRSKRHSHRTAVIFGAIQADLRGKKYCAALDVRKLWPPEAWREGGCPSSYARAYLDEKWRKRIQDEKCRYREQYEKTSAREREAIIQGENDTRRTRN